MISAAILTLTLTIFTQGPDTGPGRQAELRERGRQERAQTLEARSARRYRRRIYNADVPAYYPDAAWWVYYPPSAGQLPPSWTEVYGGFLGRMEEATR
jgi:hypothetical protein